MKKRTKIVLWSVAAALLLFPALWLGDYIQRRNASLAPGPADVENCSARQSRSDKQVAILSGTVINHASKSVIGVLIGFVPFDREGKFMHAVTYVPTHLHAPPRGRRSFVMARTMVFYPERLGGQFPASVTCETAQITFADRTNWYRPAYPSWP